MNFLEQVYNPKKKKKKSNMLTFDLFEMFEDIKKENKKIVVTEENKKFIITF